MESETRPDPPTDLLTYAITAERAGSAYMSNVRRRVEKSENFFHPAVQLLLWLYRAQ
jgi:hypothetical protein